MMTILDTMTDPALFGRWFTGPTWQAWRVFLAALFGLPLSEGDAALYHRCTGRTRPQSARALEAFMVVGRRGGKSRIAALIALFLACFHDYQEYLAPGEVGTLPVIAQDRKGARTVMRYMTGLINAVPMLREMLASEPTKETIELRNRVVIEVQTASIAAVRNYTVVGAVCDEIAFWRTDENAANPDAEILDALRPGMGTIPEAMLICLSSPYARRGALFEAHEEHFGRNDDDTLVWQADTATMHPHAATSRLGRLIAKAYQTDPASAGAEYGAEFRRDIESFVSRETVDAAMIAGRHELGPTWSTRYHAFVDPSGGQQDAMTLAIAHRDTTGKIILDCLRERPAPFKPAAVVREFAETLKHYRVTAVTGDRYAGEWPRERFREHGINYALSELVKSDLYRDLLPALNSGSVELLDHEGLKAQLCNLERRTARGGKDSIDHAPRAHDDLANAVAGVATLCRGRAQMAKVKKLVGW